MFRFISALRRRRQDGPIENAMFAAVLLLVMLFNIGGFYWLWAAIRMGSIMMFIVGILGPPITAPVGLYMLIVGTPRWVVMLFG